MRYTIFFLFLVIIAGGTALLLARPDAVPDRQTALVTVDVMPQAGPDVSPEPKPEPEREAVAAPGAATERATPPDAESDGPPVIDPRPRIAIVIDDLGLKAGALDRLGALEVPFTLAFLPYAGGLDAKMQAMREAGHEIFLHVPMQPVSDTINPGPGALLASMPVEEIEARLSDMLARFPDISGVNNHMGSRLTADEARMRAVMRVLDRQGTGFLDSVTTGRSVAYDAARAAGIPAARRDVFLDHDQAPEAVRAALARLERIAQASGSAIAIGHPHDVTLDALEDWLAAGAAGRLQIVPVSALMQSGLLPVRGSAPHPDVPQGGAAVQPAPPPQPRG